jgi:hypothetical protein
MSINLELADVLDQILPIIKEEKALHFNKTDARLANNGLPLKMQKLRCRANYESLRFAPRIEESGQKIVRLLKEKGKLVVLHLRYEMDMLAFSGCSHGCTDNEAEELTKMRYRITLTYLDTYTHIDRHE